MRRKTLFLLTVLILASCSSRAATQIFATETKPAVTAPTVEPSKTPEPSPTPDPRFKELLPETFEKCMQENVIETDADLALFMKKVNELPVNPSNVTSFISLGTATEELALKEKIPLYAKVVFINETQGINILACASKKSPYGRNLMTIVLPVKIQGGENVIYPAFTFRISQENGDKFYQRLKKSGVIRLIVFRIFLKTSSSEEINKDWMDELSLIPKSLTEAEAFEQNLTKYFGKQPVSNEDIVSIEPYVSGKILPAVMTSWGF